MSASGLVDIQAHSKTHRNLIERAAGESDERYKQALEAEVRVPRELLERKLSAPVQQYAFPFGDANEAVLEALVRNQYKLAVTVNPGGNPFFAQPLMLKRTMIYGDHDLAAFQANCRSADLPTPARHDRADGAANRSAALALLLAAALWLAAGCATPQPDLDAPLNDAPPPAPQGRVDADGLRGSAERPCHHTGRQGRLADAAVVWEILGVLRPDVPEYREQWSRTQRLIEAAVAERLLRASQAQRRGELDVAAQGYLAVLALQPEHSQAAEALRAIERERNKRNVLGRAARLAATPRTPAPARPPAAEWVARIRHPPRTATTSNTRRCSPSRATMKMRSNCWKNAWRTRARTRSHG